MNAIRRRLVFSLSATFVILGLEMPAYAQKIRVITTTPELADMTKQIGKELVDVESLTRGVEFMHAVPVKPSFVPQAQSRRYSGRDGARFGNIVAAGVVGGRQQRRKFCLVKPPISIVRQASTWSKCRSP